MHSVYYYRVGFVFIDLSETTHFQLFGYCRNSSTISNKMRLTFWCWLLLIGLVIPASYAQHQEQDDGSDFAEFEDFEDEAGFVAGVKTDPAKDINLNVASNSANNVASNAAKGAKTTGDDFYDDDDEEDGVVQDEDTEFEHFNDEEEFEGFSKPEPAAPASPDAQSHGEPKLTMAKVPMHFR